MIAFKNHITKQNLHSPYAPFRFTSKCVGRDTKEKCSRKSGSYM